MGSRCSACVVDNRVVGADDADWRYSVSCHVCSLQHCLSGVSILDMVMYSVEALYEARKEEEAADLTVHTATMLGFKGPVTLPRQSLRAHVRQQAQFNNRTGKLLTAAGSPAQ